jgi:3-hydroxyisobutyrate dehydrogenase-like beta-hydroxyacid dehydrogenase
MEAGYLGVGAMGQPMATKLVDAGHRLTILDVNPAAMQPLLDRQARQANTPKEMADQCEVVFVSLPTLGAFRTVVFGENGLLQGSRMKTLVNTCTVGQKFLREIEAAMTPRGVTIVDCPISGGPSGAKAGTLSVMVSGDPATVEKMMPLLSLWGTTVTIAGDKPGAAQVLKLTNNALFIVSLVASSEAFTMGAKGGVNPEVLLKAISVGTGDNGALKKVFPQAVLTRDFNFGAAMHILKKDMDLAVEQGEALGVPMWLCRTAQMMIHHAILAGSPNDDISTMARFVERGAGFEMPKTR